MISKICIMGKDREGIKVVTVTARCKLTVWGQILVGKAGWKLGWGRGWLATTSALKTLCWGPAHSVGGGVGGGGQERTTTQGKRLRPWAAL